MRLLRWLFSHAQRDLDRERLIFFDESGVDLSMTRRFARAPKGERAEGSAPKNWGDNITLCAGVGLRGVVAPLVLRGAMTSEIFEAYVEQFVIPEIQRGDILIWDNLGAHRGAKIQSMIEEAGAKVVFLPPYSPDLNPIEKAWSKIKTGLRTAAARSYDLLMQAITTSLKTISNNDIDGWFRFSGFVF